MRDRASDTSNATLAFAVEIASLGRSTPAPDDTEQVRRLLLDLLGVSLFGARMMDRRGTPARPLSIDQIQSKGQSLVDAAHLRFDMAAARKTIWTATDARALVDLFAG